MRHLDNATLEALGGDEALRAYFAQHLGAACDTCEAFLAGYDGPLLLDGEADALLLWRALASDAPLDDVGFQRVRRELRAQTRARRPRRWAFGAAAAASVVLLAVIVTRGGEPSPDGDEGLKGVGAAVTVELSAAHQDAAGQLSRAESGAHLAAEGALVLRAYATDTASAWLFVQRGDALEALGRFALEPGSQLLRLDGGAAAALPLAEEAGRLRLWLVAVRGSHPLPLDEARAAVLNPRQGRLATAHLDVEVGTPPR